MNLRASELRDPLWRELYVHQVLDAICARTEDVYARCYLVGWVEGRFNERGDTTTLADMLQWVATGPILK